MSNDHNDFSESAKLGFAEEFRELARQRRFVKNSQPTLAPAHAGSRINDLSAQSINSAEPSTTTKPRIATDPSLPDSSALHRQTTKRSISKKQRSLSHEAEAMLAALTRSSDQLVEARENLAQATHRIETLEANLSDANNALMANRILTKEAQAKAKEQAERCAWLEGRNETLQDALEVAVHASLVQRWRWRAQYRKAQKNAQRS